MADDPRSERAHDTPTTAALRPANDPNGQPVASGGQALRSLPDLEADEATRDFIGRVRADIRFLAALAFEPGLEQEVRRTAGDIAANVFKAWEIALAGRIIADAPADRGQVAARLLHDVKASDASMRQLADSSQAEIQRVLQEEILIILQEKRRKMDQADDYVRARSLPPQDGDALKERYLAHTETLLEDRCMRLTAGTRSQLELLEQGIRRHHERPNRQTVTVPRMRTGRPSAK